MKGLNWGILYNEYGNNVYDPNELESEINRLLQDDDITKQKGIYEYLLSGKTKEVSDSIRTAKKNGASVVFFTAYPETEIADLCDEVVRVAYLKNLDSGTKISPQFSSSPLGFLMNFTAAPVRRIPISSTG